MVLGFQISRGGEGQLQYGLAKSSWENLERALNAAYEAARPHRAAARVLRGWLKAYGPAFVDERAMEAVLQRASETASRLGHRESWNAGRMQEAGSSARDRWLACKRSALYSVR